MFETQLEWVLIYKVSSCGSQLVAIGWVCCGVGPRPFISVGFYLRLVAIAFE